MRFRFGYQPLLWSARLLLGIFLLIGVSYAFSTMLAEFYYMRGAKSHDDIPKSLAYMEKAAWWAPELQYLRIGAARITILNGQVIDPALASDILAKEINNDPWSIDLLFAYMVSRARAGDDKGASDAFLRIKMFAPETFPLKFLMRGLPVVSPMTTEMH